MNTKNIVLGLVVCLFSSIAVWGIPYSVGGHIVDVDVRSTTMLLIPGAKVHCWMQGKDIIVRASASGYITREISITTTGPGGYFKREIILPDVEKDLCAQDVLGNPLKSVYFQKDQYGFAPNEYGITAYIPEKIWKNPNVNGVDVFDLFWGIPLKTKCTIEKVEEYYRVRMTITRKALDWTSRKLIVVFDTKKKVRSEQVRIWLNRLNAVEKRSAELIHGAPQDLAKFIFYVLPRTEVEKVTNGKVPVSLKTLYELADKFYRIHQEK